jgi:hypothetical protein
LTLVPNLQNSFKLAGDGERIGKVTLDRTAGIAGTPGRRGPAMVPLRITVNGRRYEMESVRDPFLTPFLLQIATFAAVDAEQRQSRPFQPAGRGSGVVPRRFRAGLAFGRRLFRRRPAWRSIGGDRNRGAAGLSVADRARRADGRGCRA